MPSGINGGLQSALRAPTRVLFFVMAGLRPGHPRLSRLSSAKTWMPGTSPGTTSFAAKQRVDWRWRNPPIDKRKWRNTLPLFRPTTPARAGQFVELDQSDLGRPVPFAKIFRFTFDPNHLHIPAIPAHTKGRFAIVTNVGSGCDGRGWRC